MQGCKISDYSSSPRPGGNQASRREAGSKAPAPSGVRMGGVSPPQPTRGLGSVVSSLSGGPKTILVLSGGARANLVAILVANFAFFPGKL